MGIAVTTDLKTLYLTDNGTNPLIDGYTDQQGRLLRLALNLNAPSMDYKQATILYSEERALQQMVLDESQDALYFVDAKAGKKKQFETYLGSLVRFDLAIGKATTIANNLVAPFGFILSADRQTAYVTEPYTSRTSALVRLDIAQGKREVILIGGGFYPCSWGPGQEISVIVPDRAKTELWYIDVTETPASAHLIADRSLLPSVPNCVARVGNDLFPLIVGCDSHITLINR